MGWREIDGWFDEENYKMFQTIKLPKKPVILEVGTYCGKSAHVFRELWPDAIIYTCDPVDEPNRVLPKDVTYIQSKGQDLVWDKPIDLLFIDARHTYDDTEEIFNKFKDLSKIIVFHDYAFQQQAAEGVKRFVDSLSCCELFTSGAYGGAIYRV
jgi:predicted O-methyltransferase YrrM